MHQPLAADVEFLGVLDHAEVHGDRRDPRVKLGDQTRLASRAGASGVLQLPQAMLCQGMCVCEG